MSTSHQFTEPEFAPAPDAVEMAVVRAENAMEATARRNRIEKREDKIASYCPKAERIVRNNPLAPLHGGMLGGMEMFLGFTDPKAMKRLAAQKIIYLRRNRALCKRKDINWRPADASILADVAELRRKAVKYSAIGAG